MRRSCGSGSRCCKRVAAAVCEEHSLLSKSGPHWHWIPACERHVCALRRRSTAPVWRRGSAHRVAHCTVRRHEPTSFRDNVRAVAFDAHTDTLLFLVWSGAYYQLVSLRCNASEWLEVQYMFMVKQ